MSVVSTYLQCSKQDTTGNRNTDFIVVVGLLFAIWKLPIYLLENEDQIRSSVQVLFDPVCSAKECLRHLFCNLFTFPVSYIYCLQRGTKGTCQL